MMRFIKVLFTCTIAIVVVHCESIDSKRRNEYETSHRNHPAVLEAGDIMLGGLFPLHEKGDSGPCGSLITETGFQRLAAMIYAVKKINRDGTLLPGITLGIHAHDTCQNEIYAMERVLEFIVMRSQWLRSGGHAAAVAMKESGHWSTASRTFHTELKSQTMRRPIVAVIGPALSSITMAVASVLKLFMIPQISYAATSTELSDRARFNYFFRMVPPDNLQSTVMAHIVHWLKWRYVWAIGDEGPYGYKGVKSFAEALDTDSHQHVCIGSEIFIPPNAKDKFFEDLIDRIASNERAKGVILFCSETNVRRLLAAAKKQNKESSFYWLASDSWGTKQSVVSDGLENSADGSITILPKKSIVGEFDAYIRSLQVDCSSTRGIRSNPWLNDYLQQINGCTCASRANTTTQTSVRKLCSPDAILRFPSTYKQEGLVQFVIDSIYAVANALRSIQSLYCGPFYSGICDSMAIQIYNGTLVRDFIQNATFLGISNNPIKFTAEGGVDGDYDIYQFRQVMKKEVTLTTLTGQTKTTLTALRGGGDHHQPGQPTPSSTAIANKFPIKYEYVLTGSWYREGGLSLHQPHEKGTNQLFCARGGFDEPMPVSFCSEKCPYSMGYHYIGENQCCWHCERCHKDQFLNTSFNEPICQDCPAGRRQAYRSVMTCEEIRLVHIDWATIWPCIPIGLAVIGMSGCGAIGYMLFKFKDRQIIKMNGWETNLIMVGGQVWTLLLVLMQLAWPSPITCTLTRLGLPISVSMCYAAVFTRAHRIYRVFVPTLKTLLHRAPFISRKRQMIMCMRSIGIASLLAVVCLTLEGPSVEEVTSEDLPETVVRCAIKNSTFFLSMVYDILLISATTVLAWQVRSITDGFNEAKYIAFLMYSTCVVWIGLLPLYFIITSNYTVQMTSYMLCLTLSVLDQQLCMFGPKMYLLISGNKRDDVLTPEPFSYRTDILKSHEDKRAELLQSALPGLANRFSPLDPRRTMSIVVGLAGAPTPGNIKQLQAAVKIGESLKPTLHGRPSLSPKLPQVSVQPPPLEEASEHGSVAGELNRRGTAATEPIAFTFSSASSRSTTSPQTSNDIRSPRVYRQKGSTSEFVPPVGVVTPLVTPRRQSVSPTVSAAVTAAKSVSPPNKASWSSKPATVNVSTSSVTEDSKDNESSCAMSEVAATRKATASANRRIGAAKSISNVAAAAAAASRRPSRNSQKLQLQQKHQVQARVPVSPLASATIAVEAGAKRPGIGAYYFATPLEGKASNTTSSRGAAGTSRRLMFASKSQTFFKSMDDQVISTLF